MLRRLSSLAAITLLVLTACAGAASPTPTATAAPSTPPPLTPVPNPSPSSAATAPPASTAVPSSAAGTVRTSIADGAGTDEFFAEVPAAWITLTARDIANEASLAAWRTAHPEVPADAATSVANDMSTGGVALFAFDAQNAVSGFTPNLNVTWVDAPATGIEAWVVDQAASITKEYSLASALAYRTWTPNGRGPWAGSSGRTATR